MSRVTAGVRWVRPPRQSRSQETLERLFEAAEAVLSEKGFEQATVAEIAARARSSVGAFYARFHDKEGLLRCLHERFCEEAFATADLALDRQRWADATITEICCEVVPFLVRIYDERRGLIRAFIVRSGLDDGFLEAGARLNRHISTRLRELLLARQDEISHPDPGLAVDFGLRLMLHLLDQHLVFSKVQPTLSSLTQLEMARELIRAYLSYLGVNFDPNLICPGFGTSEQSVG